MSRTIRRIRTALRLLSVVSLALSACFLQVQGSETGRAEVHPAPPSTAMTGPRLREVLETQLPSASWRAIPVRQILRQLADSHSIAVLCDRRIDPRRPLDVTVVNQPLEAVLAHLAAAANAESRRVGNVIYFGPAESSTRIRTLVELRRHELTSRSRPTQTARRNSLSRGRHVRWGDLTEPQTVIELIGDEFGLTIENGDLVPHDLWAGAQFPAMSAAEMLTCVLIQYDLTFDWTEDLRAIRITPLPNDVTQIAIQRAYSPQGPSAEWIGRIRGILGPVSAETQGEKVIVRGTLEQHEAIVRLLSGRDGQERMSPPPAAVVPLDRRQFTLRAARVPASAIMSQLEESGIRFDYDDSALAASRISLETPVEIDVRQVGAKEFFDTIFSPLGLSVQIDGTSVLLTPVE